MPKLEVGKTAKILAKNLKTLIKPESIKSDSGENYNF